MTPARTKTSKKKIVRRDREGHPCDFCEDSANILKKTQEYITSGQKGEKPRVLFLNELAIIVLGKHRDTMRDWADVSTHSSTEHIKFSSMIKSLEQMQELRLQQGLLGRFNPTGRIFLLKTKHGYIESEKRILTGDSKEPFRIEIVDEGREND